MGITLSIVHLAFSIYHFEAAGFAPAFISSSYSSSYSYSKRKYRTIEDEEENEDEDDYKEIFSVFSVTIFWNYHEGSNFLRFIQGLSLRSAGM